ncbi:MAG TPA: GGDEF domain-containing protein [Rhizomicrobium sp.]|jgi:diguanylate cyclase (GGDEF)-like protein|nr:GGDEF domain-containing protein [Rhizomicrobium sp.]
MTFARLLRLSSSAAQERPLAEHADGDVAWPYDNPMLLGIPQNEFTASVRRAIWVLLGEARNLRSDLERTRALLKVVEQTIDRDHLLPVLNRRAFVRELDRQIASAARYATAASLVYLDIDELKRTNDSHGHACGDAILAHFSSILLSVLRSSDIVGRLGGDEFAILLLRATEKQAESTCIRIREAMAGKPLAWCGAAISIRFTFGVVELASGMDAEAAIAAADAAMYQNKSLRQ